MKTVSIKELFSKSWSIYKTNWELIFLVSLIYIGLSVVNGLIAKIPYLGQTLQTLAAVIFGFAMQAFYLELVREGRSSIRTFFQAFKLYHGMLLSICVTLIIILGTIFLIIPGIILGMGLFMAIYIYLERKIKITECLKESWEIMKGRKWHLFLVSLLLLFFNLLGMVPFFLGLFITLPLSAMIFSLYYLEISRRNACE